MTTEPEATLTDLMLDIDDLYLELGLLNARIELLEAEKDIK